MVSGGAPTPAAVIEHFERATGWEMIHAYGLTETGPGPDRQPRPARSEGLDRPSGPSAWPPPARRWSASGCDVDADGEVLARTAKAMDGYWEKPELSDAAFTTTAGSRPATAASSTGGILRITDRKKDVIVTGGENVSSLEVEGCLYQHPDVRRRGGHRRPA